MTRVKDVLDVWFDSGAMPYAQFHYPFENKELFESQFPADFIAEGIDQTRGWFNSLLCISTIISGESSFKNVVVNDMVLDQFGKKMSKSTGNAVDPTIELKEYGADIVRFYLLQASPVWTPLKYDSNGCKEVHSKFFNPLKNTYSFFQMYANADQIDIDECNVSYEETEEIDKWLLSKYNKLVKNITNAYEKYDLNEVVKTVTSFVSDDLSNWYIRRNRNRFWSSILDNDKKAVYQTTYEVLIGLCKLCAPVIPYTTEEIYTKLTNKESVHLEDFPKCNENLIDEEIEKRMDLIRDLISLGRNAREESKIKVRQPISEILIDGSNEELIKDLVPLIEEELNVKKVVFTRDINSYMNFIVKPNFKEVGKIFGPKIKLFTDSLLNLTEDEINKLYDNKTIEIIIDNENIEVNSQMVDIRISAKEGFNVVYQNNNFVILNTELTRELVLEGLARELISKVQNLRKENDFDIIDRINIYYNSDQDVNEAVEKFNDFIKSETLTEIIEVIDNLDDSYDLNGHEVYLKIEKR